MYLFSAKLFSISTLILMHFITLCNVNNNNSLFRSELLFDETSMNAIDGMSSLRTLEATTENLDISIWHGSEPNEMTPISTTRDIPNALKYFGSADHLDYEDFVRFWEFSLCPKSPICLPRENSFTTNISSPFSCSKCHCDNCNIYGDCCLDKMLDDGTFRNPFLEYTSCVSNKASGQGYSSYVFITKCPSNYTDGVVRERCENPINALVKTSNKYPVYSPNIKMNYMNVDCAKCHGDAGNLTVWTLDITCPYFLNISQIRNIDDITRLKDKAICLESLVPPQGAPFRRCSVKESFRIIDRCNQTGTWTKYDEDLETACAQYANPVTISRKTFRNIFCALCNGKRIQILKAWSGSIKGVGVVRPYSSSFIILFDLRPRSSTSNTCPESMVQDNRMNCRKLICSTGRVAAQNTCSNIFKTAKGLGYVQEYSFEPLMKLRCTLFADIHILLSQLADKLVDHYYTEFQYLNLQLFNLSAIVCLYDNATNCYKVSIKMETVVGGDISQHQAEEGLLTIWSSLVDGAFSNFTSMLLDSSWSCMMSNEPSSDCTFLEPIALIKSNSPQNRNVFFIELSPFSHCSQIELTAEEYSINVTTGYLETSVTGMAYQQGEYIHVRGGNHVRICVNFSAVRNTTESEEFEATLKMLTVVSMSVSICCLFSTTVILLLSNLRHTLPCRIRIALLITLTIAQILFLTSGFASGNLWGCRLAGLSMHYIWLAVFAWKQVAGFHMYVSFVHPFRKVSSHSRQFLKYTVYCFGLPMVMVICYATIHVILSNKTQIGYGGNGCFLSSRLGLGLAFIAPVSIVLISNAVFFTRVVFVIRQMSELEKHSNQPNAKHNAIFIRMSVILGFTWIVGFLANLVDNHIMWYIFVALNGGTGVLILLGQLWNERFLKPVRRWIGVTLSTNSTTQPPVTKSYD